MPIVRGYETQYGFPHLPESSVGIAIGWAVLNLILFARADIEMPDLKFYVTISIPRCS
ncbi:MAG: hypothetical protein KJ064_00460 [Anaerolineae bacterium]|nr:hypothetical protein [Anaerolineae bacterium]